MTGVLAFANPWLLAGLLTLPAIYWLIRAVPPPPKRDLFPALMLLRQVDQGEPPPSRTPLWLLLLRLTAAGLLIIALAGPLLNPSDAWVRPGPVTIILDNGWQAASRFQDRVEALRQITEQARREDRPVRLVETAPPYGGWDQEPILPELERAASLLARLNGLTPRPYAPDHEMVSRLMNQADDQGPVIFLSDGLAYDGTNGLLDRLSALGSLDLRSDPDNHRPLALLPVKSDGFAFDVTAIRPKNSLTGDIQAMARAADGRLLGFVPLTFEDDAERATARLDLPQQVRNEVARIELSNGDSAGTTQLFDARSRRPLIGLAAGEGANRPLQSQEFFLTRALEPYGEIRQGAPAELIEAGVDILIAADIGSLSAPDAVRAFVTQGGVLIRFAGPRMIASADALLPVDIRGRDRSFGGALSWTSTQNLAPFPESSPFFGIPVHPDITIARQVLARPGPAVSERTWASLEDGTPVVTAQANGEGWLILFHITANADWSTLPLHGQFVAMLRRLLPLAQGQGNISLSGPLAPLQILDGYGRLMSPPAALAPVSAETLSAQPAGPASPPGLYGSPDVPFARNLASPAGPIDGDFHFTLLQRDMRPLIAAQSEVDLMPPLLLLVLALLTIDALASLFLRGLRPWVKTAAPLILIGMWLAPVDAHAIDPQFALDATATTTLGYIETGNAQQDRLSEAGLIGLGAMLTRRTAVQPGPPQALNPARDPLPLFPFIYWPVLADTQPLSVDAQIAVNAYLRSGGVIVFDTGAGSTLTRSQGLSDPEREAALRRLLGPLDIPRLMPVDREHVLSKSFYLLDRYPGRVTGQTVWVSAQTADGLVSPLIVGGGDWASAWAIDGRGLPLLERLAEGERQRELAYRAGVNMVMYALTGTYKDDSLHLPAVLQRLGE